MFWRKQQQYLFRQKKKPYISLKHIYFVPLQVPRNVCKVSSLDNQVNNYYKNIKDLFKNLFSSYCILLINEHNSDYWPTMFSNLCCDKHF